VTPSDVDDEPITSVDDDDQDDAPFASHHITIAAAGRLDAAVAAQIDGLSRAQVQRLIDGGHVRVAGMVATKANQRVREHDVVDIDVPPPEPLELVAEPIPLSILFEDADIIVIDKPAGLVVHPAPGHTRGTLVNALLYHCTSLAGIGGVLRPGIVHRLDRDTTGVMVATKSDRAHAAISAAFAAKSRGEPGGIVREYLAIVAPPPPPSGTLRTLYGRHPVDRKKFSSKVATGKPAVTHWTTERTLATGAAALIRLRLETGRTHQIRVHMADHGWPLVGDPVYGGKGRFPDVAATLGRQALHAATLELDHPTTGARMRFESPLPADLQIAETALTIR
jgi:23S rRNA pseudouridine1911/1915/1917 synthase